jgi:hypothetical protein
LPQRLECPALEDIASNRLSPDQEGGEDHERKAKQQFALEGHVTKLTDTMSSSQTPYLPTPAP